MHRIVTRKGYGDASNQNKIDTWEANCKEDPIDSILQS